MIPEQFSTFVDVIKYRAQTSPNRVAYTLLRRGSVVDELTYGALHAKVIELAIYLQSNLAPRSRALLAYQPSLDFIVAFLGCLCAGVVPVPAYPPRRNQSTIRLESIVRDADVDVALTSSDLYESMERFCRQSPALSKLRWLSTTDELSGELGRSWQLPVMESGDIAFLQYTSGSTGNPKGVMVSHHNLLHNSAIIQQCFGHTSESKGVIWLPPYHDMGLIGGVLQPLYVGFPVILMAPVDFLQKPLRWLQAISDYGATTSGGPNFAYDLVLRKAKPELLEPLDLSAWEVAFTGAEPVRAETMEQFSALLEPSGFRHKAFYPCYGMAETTLIVSGGQRLSEPVVCHLEAQALEQNRVKKLSGQSAIARQVVGCGGSVADHKVVVACPETSKHCEDGQIGEIWVAGPSVAQGYWGRSEETQATFGAYLADTQDGPFLRTGDLGFRYKDNLFVTGRLKDLIIIRGQNYYPQDIELTIQKSHPALSFDCGAAFSVEIKRAESLVIVNELERTHLRKFDSKAIFDSIRHAVTAQHALQVYAIVLVKPGGIPKTSSGKIRRRACRTAFLEGDLKVVSDWSLNPSQVVRFQNLQSDVDALLQELRTRA